MGPVALGVLALIAILMVVRAFILADPKVLVRIVRYSGAAGLGVISVLLMVTGRIAPAFFLGSMAWGLATGGRIWPAGWPQISRGQWRPKPASGASSSVRASWVEMQLDHDTGEMSGTVLKGSHTGAPLDRLGRDELMALYREAANDDAESARLLEAWLDRRVGPEWRDSGQHADASAREAMTREEAMKILGLKEGATEDDIRSAHRRLMKQVHPDRGGSDYLAAKINRARDVLLG